MLGSAPDKIEFDIPEFKESMLIKKPLFTKGPVSAVPMVTDYIHCSLSKESAWELFLFITLAYGHIGEILFSYDNFKKKHSSLFEYESSLTLCWIDESDIKKLESTEIYPNISQDGNIVKITCLQHRSQNMVKISTELSYNKNGFAIKSFRQEKFIHYHERRINIKSLADRLNV